MKLPVVYLFLFCLLPALATSQPQELSRKETRALERQKRDKEFALKEAEKYYNYYANDTDFNVKNCPQKWLNESAVILCQQTDYTFNHLGKNSINVAKDYRMRIVLNDKNALDYFSLFYTDLRLTTELSNEYVYIKVIKKNGDVQLLTRKDAISVEKHNIPEPYIKNFEKSRTMQFFKIAIPNLEIGDILDIITADAVTESRTIYTYLNNTYPCLKQKGNYIVANHGLFLIATPINGAPNLRQYEYTNKKFVAYKYIDSDREAIIDEPFVLMHMEDPCIKVKIIEGNKKDPMYAEYFKTTGKLTPKKNITKHEMLVTFNDLIKADATHKDILDNVSNNLNIYGEGEVNQDRIVDLIFYTLRQSQNMYDVGLVSIGQGQLAMVKYFKYEWDSPEFAVAMLRLLKRQNIKADVVVLPNRSVSELENMSFRNEIIYAIKYKNKLIFAPSIFSTPQSITLDNSSTKGYLLKYNIESNRIDSVSDYIVTARNSDINLIKNNMYITLDSAMQKVNVRDTLTYGGSYKVWPRTFSLRKLDLDSEDIAIMSKKGYDKKTILEVDFTDEDGDTYWDTRKRSNVEKNLENNSASNLEKQADKIKKRKKQLLETLQFLQNENIKSIDTSYIISSGRKSDEDVFKQINIYKTDNLVSQAGENLLVSLTNVIPEQLKVEPKHRTRKHNIYFETPSTQSYTIRFFVPKGYIAQGLENYNQNVQNSIGSFISKATLVNNVIVVESTKKILVNDAPKEEWSKVLELMDAAYNFTETKFLLKKI